MTRSRKLRVATAVGALLALAPASVASAYSEAHGPDPAYPGDTVEMVIRIDAQNNCGVDVFEKNGTADVVITDAASVEVERIEDVRISYDPAGSTSISFDIPVDPATTSFGPWQYFVVHDGQHWSNVIEEISVDPSDPACATAGTGLFGNFDVAEPNAAPMVPANLAIGMGLTAAALAAGTVLRVRRRNPGLA